MGFFSWLFGKSEEDHDESEEEGAKQEAPAQELSPFFSNSLVIDAVYVFPQPILQIWLQERSKAAERFAPYDWRNLPKTTQVAVLDTCACIQSRLN